MTKVYIAKWAEDLEGDKIKLYEDAFKEGYEHAQKEKKQKPKKWKY